ncbi:hypothetical protein ANCDUO_00370, partial [Ancylostoma duodenale]
MFLAGSSLSTEENVQIRLPNDAGLSGRAIGMKTGRTHCLVTICLQNSDGCSKKKGTGIGNFLLTAHLERQICKRGCNSCLSLNQIRAELKLLVSNST